MSGSPASSWPCSPHWATELGRGELMSHMCWAPERQGAGKELRQHSWSSCLSFPSLLGYRPMPEFQSSAPPSLLFKGKAGFLGPPGSWVGGVSRGLGPGVGGWEVGGPGLWPKGRIRIEDLHISPHKTNNTLALMSQTLLVGETVK